MRTMSRSARFGNSSYGAQAARGAVRAITRARLKRAGGRAQAPLEAEPRPQVRGG